VRGYAFGTGAWLTDPRAVLTAEERGRPTQPLILETKLQPPRMRPGLVPRKHLVGRLRDGRGRRLTLVCAPAGYGKTTLLGQWEAEDRERIPFAWVSLDHDDADPVRLWNQLVLALHQVHPPAGVRSGEVLTAGPLAIVPVAIPLLIKELADAPQLVVVLEDWHQIRNPLCDDTMREFVEHAPESVQIVISSRADPGLPLARLRAHGDLAEVRAEQLRLSPDESGQLLRSGGVELESEDVERLTNRTEGWAAGLHLAAIALREQPDTRAFVDAFAGDSRHVLDYLARDVLDAVRPEMREFMLSTSILDTLSAELCDWVLESTGSSSMLTEIEQANLFLVPVHESRRIYRYHHLFARMLQRELALVDPDVVPRLHARASVWFENDGHVGPSVVHAIASRDVERASNLVTVHARAYWSSGQIATFIRWLDALSWPEAMADPQLAIMRATALGLTGHNADALERWIRIAADGSHEGALANGLQSIESGIALLRGLYLTKGLELGNLAAERAVELEVLSSPWRRQALAALGQTRYLLGDADGARDALEAARRLPDAPAQAAAASLVLSYLAFLELDLGRERPAERLALDALALLEERHIGGTPAAANAHLALGGARMLSTDGHGAVEHLERAAELSAPLSPSYWHAHALLRLADARHRLGRVTEASETLEAARSELQALPDTGVLASVLAEKDELLHGRRRREGFLGEELSESELRVLRRLVEGQSLREVAKELFLSLNTVKTHRRTIYRKLGASTREEALKRAAELGIAADEVTESPG
jgi:LuxR family transcriptional regulator, maltose regulon positive regulatory protein